MTYKITDSILELRQRCLRDCVDRAGQLEQKHYDFVDWVIDTGEYKQLRDEDFLFKSDLAQIYIKWYYNVYTERKSQGGKEDH
tara:strand:+ start:1149 stop:1397 length:249 start_codon:yes stop_codon:yes gene_type:complete